jgi:SAM-dependent methyltransferase
MTAKNDNSPVNPYDELPYWAFPIEWTSPERLALASLLHGGPRLPFDRYRMLELGCADGANLLPMAWYRRHADFVGLDASARQIANASDSSNTLALSNLKFVHGDFRNATEQLDGSFDIIMAHGVFSWIADDVRDAMLELCSKLLTPGGLLYLNYNTRPGWSVRGMVRDFLLEQTTSATNLLERAELCREISARVIAPLKEGEHAYTQLMANEFDLVIKNHPAYIAHEYLAPVNKPYWRSEFLTVLGRAGFKYVADADFNCISNRITTELAQLLDKEGLAGRAAEDSADLLCYRQMHSPVMARTETLNIPCTNEEFADLRIASRLKPLDVVKGQKPSFRHPAGHEIETADESIQNVLIQLQTIWPQSRPIGSVFNDVSKVREDLEYLLRHELIDLRYVDPGDFGVSPEPLNKLEKALRNHSTTPWHTQSEPDSAAS